MTVRATSLRAGFARSATQHAGRTALVLGARDFTYAEADDLARRWAARLVELAGGPPRRVGVFGYRSETSYIGVLAALYAGAAFVPLNRRFPPERTRAMLERADVDALLVDHESLPQLPALLRGLARTPAILLPETGAAEAPDLPGARVLTRAALELAEPLRDLPETAPDDPAYLLFTSGSTGTPKGVPITHANVRAFLDVNLARYGLTPEDRLSQTFDQTFDLSIFDLFMAWESGASVVTMNPIELLAPVRYIEKHAITVWFSVPSVASLLLKRGGPPPDSMPTLRWSLFCGEALPRATAEAWQAAAPNSIVENLYGPTELTIACAVHRWDPARADDCVHELVPIGDTYPGLRSIVVDGELADAAPGTPGELCVAGPQASPGYWRAPELTADRFFERREADGTVQRYYRTGDLVLRRDGHYVYLGRNDQQVQVGGHRVELTEIEAVLRRAGCVDAVALLSPESTIVAVVSGVDDTARLGAAASEYLPHYMVPRTIHALDELPLNGNGKVDRNAVARWVDGLKAAA